MSRSEGRFAVHVLQALTLGAATAALITTCDQLGWRQARDVVGSFACFVSGWLSGRLASRARSSGGEG